MQTTSPISRPRNVALTTSSALIEPGSGPPIPATVWNSVATIPGHTTIAFTPVPDNSVASSWVKTTMNALAPP